MSAEVDRVELRDGMLVEWDVELAMDDGVSLRADVFRPPGGGPSPAILSYGLYGKGLAFQDGYPDQWTILADRYPDAVEGSSNLYANWEVVDPERWVPEGYACIRVDSRGAGRSPGYLDPWSPREAEDAYACIEWVAAQPWCTGRVGMSGISYYAMNQWRVAALRPPHLAAICAWEGAADFYRDACYHGGILCVNRRNWFERQVKPVQHGRGERGPRSRVTGELVCGPETLTAEELAQNRTDVYPTIRAHPLDDGWHRALSADLGQVGVPFLSAGAWGGQAMHLRGNTEAFVRAASADRWLELHGGEHWASFYTARGVELQRRFFGRFLRDERAGWPDEPRVRLRLQRVDGTFEDRAESEWPLRRTRWGRLHLASTGDLRPAPSPTAATLSFDALGEGVELLAPPVGERTELTGPASAKLFVSSSTADADLFLVIRVYDPDGREIAFQGSNDPRSALGKGWLRASHRRLDEALSTEFRPYHRHDRVEPLSPGEIYELDVEIWPLSVILPQGFRVALRIQGRDFERDDSARLANFAVALRGSGPYLHDDPDDRPPDVFGGVTTIHLGPDHPSSLLLPVIPSIDPAVP
ncbi:MAG TPA: CocE/NonD family hydrolase [Gaiellaceae bacterium]|nr:CocE/NonD family hydrolase [Gaiellaceae bacterium]